MTDGIRLNSRGPVDCSRGIGDTQSTRNGSVTPFRMTQSDQVPSCDASRQPTLTAIRVQVEQAAACGMDRCQTVEKLIDSELAKAFGPAINPDVLRAVLDRTLHDPNFSQLVSQVLQATQPGVCGPRSSCEGYVQ